ncbi:MAG TPA: lipid A deacylase LpxR family protein, partial [Usitatibacteraceae bacterium]|nr:lipid A deacylase LpxR family protein [Usitatibacteraceae bacterium]
GTDRWYTSGVRIYRSALLDEVSPFASFLRGCATREQRFDVGILHEVYTGDGRADPTAPDRPNAGRLLLSFARHDLSPDTLASLGIDAGVSGPAALGERVQEIIHRIAPAPHTDWTRQVDNRADVQVTGAWSRRLMADAIPGALVMHGGAAAGTITAFGHAGIEWRTDSPAEAANPLLRFAATPPMPRNARGLSLFAGASLRAIARNRVLGRRSDDPKPEAAREHRVSRVAAGLAWSEDWGVVTLGLAQDSREFDGQRSPHRFGSLTVSFPAD